MTLLSLINMRAKRTFLCLARTLPKAMAVQSAFLMSEIIFYAVRSPDTTFSVSDAAVTILTVLLISWIAFFVIELTKYSSSNSYHRYDSDLIGSAFTGINRKSAVFENGLELFHKGHFRSALEVFTDLDNSNLKRTDEEQRILDFFRGRCYHILGTYPNALMCYDKADERGMDAPILPLFIARCCISNGDIERAKKIYNELLDTDYEFRDMIRTEYGKMYLKLNDGQNALKWFQEAIDRHENYADALGGAAIAQNMLHNFKEGEELYRAAMLNNIEDPKTYSNYYKEIQAAVLLETHTDA